MTNRGASAFEWHDLDERAVDYGLKELAKGRTLASACLGLVGDSRPKAYLPSDTPAERIYAFNEGRINRGSARDAALPVELLWEFLTASDPGWQRAILFEDPYARPTDRFIGEGRSATSVAFLGDEVYQLITPDRAGDSLQLPVAEFPIIGVVTRLEVASASLHDGVQLTEEVVKELAYNSLAVVVGAWDAENYVVLDRGLVARAEVLG